MYFPPSRGSQLQLQAMPQQKGHREASLCLTCPEAAMVLDEDGFILFIGKRPLWYVPLFGQV